MNEYPQRVPDSWSERMRRIRFRRKRENLRFWNEFKLVPRWLIWAVFALFLIAQGISQAVLFDMLANGQGDQIFAPELKDEPLVAATALFGIVTAASLAFAAMVFMVGYVNKDSKRRGMNSGLWTFLTLVFVPNSLVIGFIIYLLMREPLPYNCPQCSAQVDARFNFCPNCRSNLHPLCPQCKQEVVETDKYCPYCACDLAAAKTAEDNALPTVVPNSP